MAWKILCMDCDLNRIVTDEEKYLKKCPNCNSENIQIYDDEVDKGAHCAGTINPSALKK
jgi:Zn finger protein HypA/HybF involved in hydrogenase expression